MPILKIPEPYAINTAYARVADAARLIGEQCIALNMFRVGVDDDTAPRCVCYNEIYEQTQQYECPSCFGTTFSGGIKEAWRIWAIFDDNRNQEDRRRQGGVYLEGHNSVQTEPWPALYPGDYLVRVPQWDISKGAPISFAERYIITDCQNVSVRSGSIYGNANSLQIAQAIQAKLQPPNHMIYNYNIMTNIQFPRRDGQPR